MRLNNLEMRGIGYSMKDKKSGGQKEVSGGKGGGIVFEGSGGKGGSVSKLLANRIKTPDGTILESVHRHDYKTYIDKNGLEYMVDGGLEYLRRNVQDSAPATEMSVYNTDPHETIREAFKWGTRGKDGKQPLTYILLKDLATDHIEAILETQTHITEEIRQVFIDELEHRNGHSYVS